MRSIRTNGFTLVEVMLVAPLVILLIGTFIGVTVAMTGESLQSSEKGRMAHDTQAALDDIEVSINQSTNFLASTADVASINPMRSPQGKDNAQQAFTNTSGSSPETLLLHSPATSTNPYNSARTLVYQGSSPCDSTQSLFQFTTVYFVDSSQTLYKRTILDGGSSCKSVWQRNSCADSIVSTNTTVCKTRDEKLLTGVNALDISYFETSSDSIALNDLSAAQARTAAISITVSRNIAGQALTYTGSTRATSINSRVDATN